MTLYVCMYAVCYFRVVHVRGPPVDPAMSLPSSDAMHLLASAALAKAENVKMRTPVLAALPPPIVREELGETSSGHRVTLLQQHGRPPKMKVGSGNRGGAKVRARQESPLGLNNHILIDWNFRLSYIINQGIHRHLACS